MTVSELLLVRHCESAGQESGAPLTSDGLQQATLLATFLRSFPVDAILCSPFRRALESIAPFAAQTRIDVEEDARLVERTLSAEPQADWREQLQKTWRDFDHRAPGGETSREAQQRARGAVDEIASRGNRCVVVVSHGNWIGLVLHSIDPCFDFAAWERLSNPDVFRLRLGAGADHMERVWCG